MPEQSLSRLERAVLLAPDVVARRAAALADAPDQAWMLRQPRRVRRSYVEQVIDGTSGDPDVREQIWMLQQDDDVRESFITDVLQAEP